jgi:hypothetical protein
MREIDRRKVGAARQAKEKRDASRRAMWRENKRNQRLKASQIRNAQANQSERPAPLPDLSKDKQFQALFGDKETPPERKPDNAIRRELTKLTKDPRAPASARVTALRTLAEMDGHIGRLQDRSGDTVEAPLSTLSREQLEAELDRLRGIVARQDA